MAVREGTGITSDRKAEGTQLSPLDRIGSRMATRVRSYSKINLGLAIGPVRADGFHGLTTLYQTLALHDVVTVEAKPTSGEKPPDMGLPCAESKITLTTNHPDVP